MSYLIDGLRLSMAVTPTLIFLLMGVGGLVNGRSKIEPSRPWVEFRDQPVKFSALASFHLIMAGLFAFASVRIASGLLR